MVVKRVEAVLISGDSDGCESISWKCLFVATEFGFLLVRLEQSKNLFRRPYSTAHVSTDDKYVAIHLHVSTMLRGMAFEIWT